MLPPYISNTNPFPGETLTSNVITVFGNGFQYMDLNPSIKLLPSGEEAIIYWEYSYDIHHAPEGMTGGSSPGEMKIWIKDFHNQKEFILEVYNFRATYKIYPNPEILSLPENRSYK